MSKQSLAATQSMFAGQFAVIGNNRLVCETSHRRVWLPAFLLATLMMLLSFSAQGQTLQPVWGAKSPATSPSKRYIHGMSYDAARGQTVLFGGYTKNDTWLWDGTNWTQANPVTSPPARGAMSMAFDPRNNTTVMFGGLVNAQTRIGDTWLWDGTNWTQSALTGPSPSGRAGSIMAWDPSTNSVLLYGGVDLNGSFTSDTWLWGGTDWAFQPTSGPTARGSAAMVYDPISGRLILFGGLVNGTPANDTWAWTSSGWSQLSPANSPPAREGGVMAYDAALGQIVLFGGVNSGTYLNDTWYWTGTNWTQAAETGGDPVARENPSGMAYDAARGQVVLFGGLAASGTLGDTQVFGLPGNFGNVTVCPPANSSACGAIVRFPFSVPNTTNFGAPQILTQGAQGLDFAVAPGSTCTGTVAPGSCDVYVKFTAAVPGLRTGAVQLMSNTGTMLSSSPMYGVGQGPDVLVGPSTFSVLPVAGQTLNAPRTITVDAQGNQYIADTANQRVLKITTAGVVSTVGVGLLYPQQIAVDGAGTVYIADNSLGTVVKVPAGCTVASCQTNVGVNLTAVLGTAVDVLGNVFISEFNVGTVVKVPVGCTTAACQTVAYSGGAGSNTVGIALDAAGDLFVADFGLGQVVKVPVGCTISSCRVQVGQGWSSPESVAVDAAGDVFIAQQNSGVVKVPAGCATASCQILLYGGGSTFGVTVDAKGTVYIADDLINQIDVISSGQTLSFATTNVGNTSTDSPKSFNFTNIGNQPLHVFSPGLVINGPDFLQVPGTGTLPDCTNAFTLTPGQSCNTSISFRPVESSLQPLQGTAVFNDDALNSAGTTQSVGFSGTGLPSLLSVNVSMQGGGTGTVTDNLTAISCSEANHGSSVGTCSANYSLGNLVTFAAKPTGTSVFLGWGGLCAGYGTSPICIISITQAGTITADFVDQNFGSFNVCPVGQPIAGPCSTSLPVTFNLAANTVIGAVRVVTQGATGLDFTQGTGGSCTGTIPGGACVVNVNFKPLAPGLRTGAVQLFDATGNLVSSLPIYGVGQEPAIAFGPGAQSYVSTGAFTLSQPKGVLTDAAGNLFISDGDPAVPKVLKVAPDGTVSSVGVGLQFPQGIAEDGAGNLYIADNNRNQVVVVPAGCTTSACQTVIGSNYRSQLGVAVDGAGNVFFGDFQEGEVVKSPAGCNDASCQTIVYNPGPGSNPLAIALDSAGDLFVGDFGLQKVVKIPAGCADASCQVTVGSGWSQPDNVAVDAAGDVFVADAGLNELIEVPAGCSDVSCQIVLLSGIHVLAVAVDATGNLFVDDLVNRRVIKLTRSVPPSFSFATTNVGSMSTDSPQGFLAQNVGNQPLTGALTLNLGGNFTQIAGPDCSTSFPLAPGAICSETFSFTPQIGTFASGTATFTDNTLNNASPLAVQVSTLSGTGAIAGQAGTVAVPDLTGQPQSATATPLAGVGLVAGTVTSASSTTVPVGSVISQSPDPGTQVAVGSAVNLLVSSGQPVVPAANPLLLENNYFLTGDYVSAGVTLHGMGVGGVATGTITIPPYVAGATQGVPAGADVVDAFLYWETVENTATASSANGTFNGYAITGQQIGSDVPNYVDGALTGTLRSYRASVNVYLPANAAGIRLAAGSYTVSLPDGKTALPLTQGASLVLIYRVLSKDFPLKSVVLYDGAVLPTNAGAQVMKGFYDAVGGASGTGKFTSLSASGGVWSNSVNNATTLGQANQFSAPLNPGIAYAAVILSTAVNNTDNDGILDAWKTGPSAPDFHAGQPGYYDAKTSTWVGLPGAKHGQKDLFVQLDYMCGGVLADGSCDPAKENLFPSPDANGNDPLAMVKQAFLNSGVQLHLQVGNAVPESTCVDDLTTTPVTLCQFPNQPGVVGWKNSLQFSKLYPRNLIGCLTGGDCTTRFPFGQKDSYHYVLMGHSLAVPAWNSRFGTLTAIAVANGVTTITTVDRGTGINACPSRITLGGVLGNPSLNGIYNTTSCSDTKTITVATPGVPNWSYPNNNLPEPVIGLTSGTISSISGYSDLGGADSAVTLGLWLTAPNQDMSKRANVIAGTIFHEIGHTLGLGHGGLYYDTPNSYVPTFEANCKPNYQSVMNYLFQLDLLGPSKAIAFSNQTLATINESAAGSTKELVDLSNNPASFPTSAWYVPYTVGATASPATRHCDGTPLNGDQAYRVDASIAPVTPAWTNGQDINFIGSLQTQERGYNDIANMDLRQIGATGGEFASLSSQLYFGSSVAPLNINAGGTVALGSGGTVALGSGGTVTLGSGGNVTLGSGGTIALGSGGTVTLGSGGNVTLGAAGVVTPGSSGIVALGSGGTVTLGSGGIIALGSGGTVALGSGGVVTLGSGGVIALGNGNTVTIPSSGGSYTLDALGGIVTLGSGGTVALGSGGIVTLGSGGTIALGSGGTVALGSGGNVTLGSGGTVALGSGGVVALGSGGNVTLGSGGTVALGSGGIVTLGSGGTVTLGSGGTVTLGSGGNVTGSGGTVTLGSGGSATIGAGGTVALGSGGTVALGSGGTVALGSGGTITLGSGGIVTLGSGGTVTLGSGGIVTLGSGGAPITIGAGGTVTLGSGGTVTLGSGGTVALGSGGTVTLGSGGVIALGSGGTVTLGSGGTVTLGSGGVVTLGNGGGSINLGSGSGSLPLGTVSNAAPGSGGPVANELTYETANSVVRPPTAPIKTSTPNGVRITWTAPAFGVVSTYTISRSSDGAAPIVIGSVSGVNGNPPATEFIDTNPDLVSQTVVYTIATTLVPDVATPTPRQSPPSVPAVVKNDQSVALGPLPSSVTVNTPLTVTATAMSSGVPNGLRVLFSTSGSCTARDASVANGISSAAVSFSSTGSCTITASQSGSDTFNPANAVSGTLMVLPQGSGTQSQTIYFASLQNAVYGGSFTPSATSSSGLPVNFSTSGPCTAGGAINAIGLCTITASAPANNTYSAASVTQSFRIFPAVLKVTANSFTVPYGGTVPSLTYAYSGFVKNETASVVAGAPALATTAVSTVAGAYPITVSTGTLASMNYSFLYVNGTVTVLPGLTLVTTSPLVYNQSETLSVTGGVAGGGAISYKVVSGPCTVSGTKLTANSGTGSCALTAAMAARGNVGALTSSPAIVTLSKANQAIAFINNPPANAQYGTSFSVAARADSGVAVSFTSSGACTNNGGVYTITAGTGTCSVIANQAGNANYAAAATVTKTVTATAPVITLSASSIDFGTVYQGSATFRSLTITNTGTAPATINDPLLTIVRGGNSNEFLALTLCPRPLAVGKSCVVTIAFLAGPFYTPQTATLQIMNNSPSGAIPVALTATVINPQARFDPPSVNFGTIKRGTTSTVNVTLSNPGSTPLILNGIGVTGANAASFAQGGTCGASLAAGAKCNIAVSFKPSASGNFNAAITVTDNARSCGNGAQVIPLSGRAN